MKQLNILGIFLLCLTVCVTTFADNKKDKKEKPKVVSVTGYITDINKEPISPVFIDINKNSAVGVVSIKQGYYSLFCDKSDTLIFRADGFVTKVIPVNGREEIDVILEKIPENLLPAQDTLK